MGDESLAERFETDRARLHRVAYRLLGSAAEADDAVQETWLRLSRSGAREVENLSAWLTTVVGRVCLDLLRARRSRREEPLGQGAELLPGGDDAERAAGRAESVGRAMRTVLQRLGPAERVAFVLHDVFGVPHEEVARVVGRSPAAARQLASRGRRRVRSATEEGGAADLARQREVVEAFFRAAHAGDFRALLAVLDPDVTLRADAAALRMGARRGGLASEIRGAEAVAERFDGQARAARLARIDGRPGGVWAAGGRVRVAFEFTIRGGRVAGIELMADPGRLGRRRIEILP